MTNPILYTSKTCKFCDDVITYATFTNTTLTEVDIADSNPHGLRSAPAIAYEDNVYIGLDNCAAFLRRHAKEQRQ
ncbi:hypothetical protein H5079_04700 [Pseudoalteromonas sp. SG44-5]|uniref:hypothetical protein n=1 Tax=Pseudoalteromonas sp. SG44-5 TaxID=2760960 RepID=UPI0015FAF2C9|nr:hypothetical protein [Pseudoalteromonas sp. SG44-5]MBB1404910.1 hypothetical protein [Pseudoalteromonas sp. SG44-5]